MTHPMMALSRCCDVLHDLDADDRHNAGSLELPPGVAEECLHGGGVEPAADLIRTGDAEAFTGGGEQTAAFKFFLQRLAFGFCALEQSVSVADRVG
jgi:hypothetical protein